MAYVQPNSVIQLFQGINLDNRYMHTIYFANETAQNAWFTGKVYKSYQAQSYTRYTRNQIKLKEDATNLLGCTYLRFKNDRSVDKWFYAFITSVEYINENTTLVSYEIDVMQTWFIQDGSIRPCMVLREHVNDDTFGINLEEEPIGSDVYDNDAIELTQGSVHTGFFDQYSIVVSTSEKPDNGSDYNNGLYCGTNMKAYIVNNAQTADQVTQFLDQSLGDWNRQDRSYDIVDLYTFPSHFSNSNANANREQVSVLHPTNLGGYTPKNNKLFGYPFSFLFATTMDGDSEQYRWEYFAGDNVGQNVTFAIVGNPLGGGSIICYPRDYNGIAENYDAKLVMSDFPKNSANLDAYHAWVASGQATKWLDEVSVREIKGQSAKLKFLTSFVGSSINNLSDIAGGTAGVAGGLVNKNEIKGVGQITDGIKGISSGMLGQLDKYSNYMDYVASEYEAWNKVAYKFNDASYVPNTIIGRNTPCISVSDHALDFYFFNCHVRADEIKRLDDFLSCYGYSINKVKAPNLTGRQYWNFVQTHGAVIAGNMPSSSKEAIARIFDGGITFWHNGDNVGNYNISVTNDSINNPIVS